MIAINVGNYRKPVLIFELKKYGGDPLSQAIVYYVNYVIRSPGFSLVEISHAPCFLLTLDGTNLNLYCIQFLQGSGVHVESVFSFVVLSANSRVECLRLARFLTCLKRAVNELIDWYTQKQSSRPFTRFPTAFMTGEVSIKYQKVKKEGKLFEAVNEKSGERCFVKVSAQRYGKKPHQFLIDTFAGQKVAPKVLFDDENLFFGSHFVVLEYLDDYVTLDKYYDDNEFVPSSRFDDIFKRLSILIDTLHQNGFVHGDLRTPNILIHTDLSSRIEDAVVLIDFDWSGEEGKVFYPSSLNLDLEWASGVRPIAPILKKHDTEMLGKIEQLLFGPDKKRMKH